MVAALIDAAVVCGLAAVPLVQTGQVALLYALLALQFSAAAFYEPGEALPLFTCAAGSCAVQRSLDGCRCA